MLVPDVRKQILVINQKAREGEQKQLEAEKLQKLNEMVMPKLMVIKKRDDGCVKILKVSSMICVANKDEDDKMRATAANVAARTTVGGDDMLSKWQS
ncbi:transcription initiation factor TFIID subunit 4b-like isoform X1 [Rhododendron vialii]|uniref:transcription initiation factor TFIID subunit 4b-like isoform X1 n=1 Tax=Rhododendron vialii TaxID=182163 RepID=UPI00265E3735|nr:transcription initiation factor TFIID subunit 4b-like isoform X1 [Rhododendron vialii]XP_058192859.1 transcription initiation factor TFIID subunit 4b-like isoform X1 [Rhododendron vialii]XP_058192860.1 transcription initiation factor TFIID subunit 4b-like isoform X1 [Rhododendron vialii]XP_058192861.1 transcription initiation factor TFIID subunit 4b-like isoform X1 [Rhododendron vialii]